MRVFEREGKIEGNRGEVRQRGRRGGQGKVCVSGRG